MLEYCIIPTNINFSVVIYTTVSVGVGPSENQDPKYSSIVHMLYIYIYIYIYISLSLSIYIYIPRTDSVLTVLVRRPW